MGAQRGYGNGSIHQDARGRWVGTAEYPRAPGEPRRKKRFVGRDRAQVEERLAQWVSEHRPYRDAPRPVVGNRAEYMEAARTAGTHTQEEWAEKVATYQGLCHYCGRRWGRRMHKDHVIPVSRGGSDALDNVVPACARCNMEKSNLTESEFHEQRRLLGQGVRAEPPRRRPGRPLSDEAQRRLAKYKQGFPEHLGGLL